MADLSLSWQGDLRLTPAGDLALVDGTSMVREHLERRLLTAVKGYVFHQEFGAGLPQQIGRTAQPRVIQAIVQAQIALDATIAKFPVPVVEVVGVPESDGVFSIGITYTDAVSGLAREISMEVPGLA